MAFGKLGAGGRGFGKEGSVLLGGSASLGAFTSNVKASNTSNFRSVYRANTRNTRVAIIGDSTDRGQSFGVGTSQATNAWPMQLASALQTAGVNAGAQNVWCDGGSWGQAQTIANFLTGDARCGVTGAWALGSGKSPGGNAFACTATGTMTFLPQGNFDTVEVYWRDGALGRNITVQIGSDTPVAINSTGPTQLAMTPVTAVGGVGHQTITLTWVAGSAGALGISCYDSTRKEVTVWNWGICGGTSTNMVDNSDTAVGRLACMTAAKTKPDLAIVEGGVINDWRTSLDVTTVTIPNLTSMVTTLKGGGSDVILRVPNFDNGSAGLTAQQQNYVNAMYQVSAAQNVGIIDIRKKWVSYANAVTNGWNTASDAVHPTAAGYVDIGNVVRDVILAIK